MDGENWQSQPWMMKFLTIVNFCHCKDRLVFCQCKSSFCQRVWARGMKTYSRAMFSNAKPNRVQYEVVNLIYFLWISNKKGEEPTKQSNWFQSLLLPGGCCEEDVGWWNLIIVGIKSWHHAVSYTTNPLQGLIKLELMIAVTFEFLRAQLKQRLKEGIIFKNESYF